MKDISKLRFYRHKGDLLWEPPTMEEYAASVRKQRREEIGCEITEFIHLIGYFEEDLAASERDKAGTSGVTKVDRYDELSDYDQSMHGIFVGRDEYSPLYFLALVDHPAVAVGSDTALKGQQERFVQTQHPHQCR